MAEVIHLPGDCSVQDIVEVVEEQGTVVVDDFVSRAWLDEFNAALELDVEGYAPPKVGEEFYGHQTIRTTGLPSKVPIYIDHMTDERLLGVMDHFLGPNCGQVQLSSSEIAEIRGVEKAQDLHRDDILWPINTWLPEKWLQFNTLVAANDFTLANGATQVVPYSHKWEHDREAKPEEVARAVMRAGSIVLVPGKTLHGAGANTDGSVRRAIVTSYALGWLRPYENHFLSTSVEQVRHWPEKARQLLGYDLYRHADENLSGGPLGFYEYDSPALLFR